MVSSELVRRAQAGDEEAFREIVSVYYRPVSGSLARLVSLVKADDLTAETFLRLQQSLDRLSSPAQFEPWLFRITFELAYDYLRNERHRGMG